MKIEEVEKKVNEMGYNTEWRTSETGNRYLCANVQGVSVNFRKLRAMNSETVKGEFFPDAVNDIIYFAEAYAEDIKSGGANINALEYSYMWAYAGKNNNPIAFTENEDRECTAKIPNFDGLDEEVISVRSEILARRGAEYREMKEYKDFL